MPQNNHHAVVTGGSMAGLLATGDDFRYPETEGGRPGAMTHLMHGPKWMLDVAGHYARPDVFELTVHRKART